MKTAEKFSTIENGGNKVVFMMKTVTAQCGQITTILMNRAIMVGIATVLILLAGCGKKNVSRESPDTPPTAKEDASPSSFINRNALPSFSDADVRAALPSEAEAQALKQFDVSQYGSPDEQTEHFSVTTNDVVLVKRPSGAMAVIQFTWFGGPTNCDASYRWRYLSAPSQPVQTGIGHVRESYNQTPTGDGKGVVDTPKSDNDTTVKAGDIWIEWSCYNESSGWLYYYHSRATIQILSSDSFNKDL